MATQLIGIGGIFPSAPFLSALALRFDPTPPSADDSSNQAPGLESQVAAQRRAVADIIVESGSLVYKHLGSLGVGCFGELQLRKIGEENYAVKLYEKEESGSNDVETLRDIIARFVQIRSPNICEIVFVELPTEENGLVIWYRFLGNGSLQDKLSGRQAGGFDRLGMGIRVKIVWQVLVAVAQIHDEGLLHGYLHPCKILLDEDLNIKITGFLNYTLEHYHLVSVDQRPGPEYTAPEVYDREDGQFSLGNAALIKLYQPSDAFTVSLLCYKIITGRDVFQPGLTAAEYRRATPSSSRPSIPEHINLLFWELIQLGWDADPRNRPTIPEMLFMIHTFCNDTIVQGVEQTGTADVPEETMRMALQLARAPDFGGRWPICELHRLLSTESTQKLALQKFASWRLT
jgi:serine/threonine protein kinase